MELREIIRNFPHLKRKVDCLLTDVKNLQESDTYIQLNQKTQNFSSLSPGSTPGDLAYVEESQGTSWLPGTLGGSYYPAGFYLWTGSEWVSDRNALANQLENIILSLANKVDKNEVGYGLIVNTLHTEQNPFSFQENVPFTLPIRNDSIVQQNQSTPIIDNLIDNATNRILVGNLNDKFSLRVEFKVKTSLSDRKGVFLFDIGTAQKFNFKKFTCSDNANVAEPVSENITFFQGVTFQNNGGTIETTINGDGVLYDVQLLIEKTHHGKNI